MSDEIDKVLAPFQLKGLGAIDREFGMSDEEKETVAYALIAKEQGRCIHGTTDPRSCPDCEDRRRKWKDRRPI